MKALAGVRLGLLRCQDGLVQQELILIKEASVQPWYQKQWREIGRLRSHVGILRFQRADASWRGTIGEKPRYRQTLERICVRWRIRCPFHQTLHSQAQLELLVPRAAVLLFNRARCSGTFFPH